MEGDANGTVAVAMSGGADSSAAAAVLRARGCRLIGLTAVLSPGFSRCCSDEDVRTAQHVARQLGFPHHVVDLSEVFEREIIAYFVREYLDARTPSPCVRCNRLIKFGALLEEARRRGAARLATGHYARVRHGADGPHLLRGADADKDQSYFLALLSRAQLAGCVLPLGTMTKRDALGVLRQLNLAARNSRESQELCFIDEVDHGTWIEVRRLDAGGPGDILDTAGRRVGRHGGLHHYTVGQRRGLGVAAGAPVYVTALDRARNVVVVGTRAEACRANLEVAEASWIAGREPAPEFRARVQIRYRHEAAPARVRSTGGGRLCVEFDEPQFAVAPGQLAVFYEGEEVLGGGWIAG